MDITHSGRFRFYREEDLRKAIALSEEEEAKRKRELEDANAKALFDDSQQVYVYQCFKRPCRLIPLCISSDLFAQQPMQQMSTGWPMQQMQPQYTSFNASRCLACWDVADASLSAFHAAADDATAAAGRVYATADDVAGTGETETGMDAGMQRLTYPVCLAHEQPV